METSLKRRVLIEGTDEVRVLELIGWREVGKPLYERGIMVEPAPRVPVFDNWPVGREPVIPNPPHPDYDFIARIMV